jgi:hypothetical protein
LISLISVLDYTINRCLDNEHGARANEAILRRPRRVTWPPVTFAAGINPNFVALFALKHVLGRCKRSRQMTRLEIPALRVIRSRDPRCWRTEPDLGCGWSMGFAIWREPGFSFPVERRDGGRGILGSSIPREGRFGRTRGAPSLWDGYC